MQFLQKTLTVILVLFTVAIGVVVVYAFTTEESYTRFTEIEAGFEDVGTEGSPEDISEMSDEAFDALLNSLPSSDGMGYSRWSLYWREFSRAEYEQYVENFTRPPGPLRVGVQVGHWRNDEVPEELEGLKQNGGGAQGGGLSEVDVVYIIAEHVQERLEAKGIAVDFLPATIPVDYIADAFVSIHADGNNSGAVSGFKIAAPRRDFSEHADELLDALYTSYEQETGLSRDENVTRRMSSYYAFNWRRYDHALHPMTPAVIVETGFLTSPTDRAIIVDAPERAAKGIAGGILAFLNVP